MSPLLLTVSETAQLLNTSEDRVRRMAREGLLPVVKLGRLIRFNKDELHRWIEAGGQSYPGGWRKEAVAN